eukprot:COSAG01_NODE_5858_length_3987_cov_188.262346_4_plen_131_part_00
MRNFKRSCLDYDQKKVRLLTEVISAEEESPVKKSKRGAPGTALGAASQGAGAGKKLGGASAAAKKKRGKNNEGGENAEEVAASIEASQFLDGASVPTITITITITITVFSATTTKPFGENTKIEKVYYTI